MTKNKVFSKPVTYASELNAAVSPNTQARVGAGGISPPVALSDGHRNPREELRPFCHCEEDRQEPQAHLCPGAF